MFCTYCGRSFNRDEHLQRHILTHTKVRPFECRICHMAFTRRDLVQKHYLAHGKNTIIVEHYDAPEGGDGVSTVKPRIAVACFNCARSKTKCDNQQPCSRCKSKGLACIPRKGRRSKVSSPCEDPTLQSTSIDGLDSNMDNDGNADNSVDGNSCHDRSRNPRRNIQEDSDMTTWAKKQTSDGGVNYSPKEQSSNRDELQENVNQNHASGMVQSTVDDSLPFQMDPQASNPAGQSFFSADGATPSSPLSPRNSGWTRDFCPSQWQLSKFHTPELTAEFDSWRSGPEVSNADLYGNSRNDTLCIDSVALGTMALMMDYSQPIVAHANVSLENENAPSTHQHYLGGGSSTRSSSLEQFAKSDSERQEIHAKDLDFWSLIRCTPLPKTVAPQRAQKYIARLEENHKDLSPWSGFEQDWRRKYFKDGELFENVPLSETARERVLAIAQNFYREALDTHGLGPASISSGGIGTFMLLPTTMALRSYLENFLNFFEPYYPLVSERCLNPNKLTIESNGKGGTLLLLLLVAYGAMVDPAQKARRLSAGLMEICRISIYDLIEKDTAVTTTPLMLQCGLLFTVQASWSGEKWTMDFGMCQRYMYLVMLRNGRFLDKQDLNWTTSNGDGDDSLDQLWKTWTERELKSRLAYSWVMADQELSLFYDNPPLLSITEVEAVLPDHDELWLAANALEWKQAIGVTEDSIESVKTELSRRTGYSLSELFQLLLDDGLNQPNIVLEPLHLRLLLFPLQLLVCNLSQSLKYFSNGIQSAKFSKTLTRTSSLLRFEEVQCLMDRWWNLCNLQNPTTTRQRVVIQASLILYHLINLSLLSSFKEMESFARGECSDWRPSSLQDQWFRSPEDVLFHCGQILRLIRKIPIELRPIWWSAAAYRATIIIWAYSISNTASPHFSNSHYLSLTTRETVAVAIDALEPCDSVLQQFTRHKIGTPQLTRADGTLVSLDNPKDVLSVCIDVLDGGSSASWFAEGTKCKIQAMAERWESKGLTLSS